MSLTRDHLWTNFIVANRTPHNWKAFGADIGKRMAENEWDEFLFYRDPRELALTPRAVEQKAEKEIEESLEELSLYGTETWSRYGSEAKTTPKEQKIWATAFIDAYSDVMDAQVKTVIPPKFEKKLTVFCSILTWLRRNLDHGDAKAADYGLKLSGSAWKHPAERLPQPSWKEMVAQSHRQGRESAAKAWKNLLKGEWAGIHLSMLSSDYHPVRIWDISEDEGDELFGMFRKEFISQLGKKLQAYASPSIWKNSFLICVLYDHRLHQEYLERPHRPKYDEEERGFRAFHEHKSWAEQEAREEWKRETREEFYKEFQKDIEETAARRAGDIEFQAAVKARGKSKVAGSTLGATRTGNQTLVVTNLSLLDDFTAATGEEWGWVLAQNLEEAIRTNPGPAVIVDSFAPLQGTPETAPRAWLVTQLLENEEGISWIQYNETSEDPYADMLEELIPTLDHLSPKRVVIGGIWYGADEEGDCVDPVIDTIGLYYPVEVRETLVGCGV